MKAQLTIYVAPPLLDQGGTVIVVANPISLEEWKNCPEGANPAAADPNNEKKKTLKADDRLFGVVASTKVSIVEFVYPDEGTYGYNFVAVEDPAKRRPPLRTKQILAGSQRDLSEGPNPKTKDASVIHVYGPGASQADSRIARANQDRIERLNPRKTIYEGVFLLSPTDEQVDAAVHYKKLAPAEAQK